MSARYQPWWMPTALAALLLLSVALFAALVIGSAKAKPALMLTEGEKNREIFEWDLVTSWPKRFPGLGMGPEMFAEKVLAMSDGRLVITVHGGNSIVPALGVFDAVSSGSVEMGHSSAYYWKGKIPAAVFFTSVPFGMTAQEYNAWISYGGGLELWRELYKPYNLIPFPGGNTGVQMGGWFNVEINDVSDIQGLKMRIPGLGGEVFSRSGGTAVNIPGAELFNALQTGVIDATEWVGPYNDLAMGFHQIAKHYYYPGWHEPGPAMEFTVNKTAYDSLPKDLQEIIDVAAKAVNQQMLDEYQGRSQTALIELKQVYGVDIRRFPESVLAVYRKNALALYEELSKGDEQFAKVYQNYWQYLESARNYSEIGEKAYLELR